LRHSEDFPKASICIKYGHKGVIMLAPLIIHDSSFIQKSSKEDDGRLYLNQKRKIRRFL